MNQSATKIERSAVEALLNPAKTMLFANALIDNERNVLYAQATIKALRSVLHGIGKQCSEFQESKGGYYVPASWQAAWSTLPEGIENFSLPQVQEFLVSSGLQISLDRVSNGDVARGKRLEHCEVSAVNLNNEHDPARADLNDDSGLHDASLVAEKTIVAQGGAA